MTEQKLAEKLFDPDKLFQEQLFFKSFRVRTINTRHLVKEKRREDAEDKTVYTALCGEETYNGSPESLKQLADRENSTVSHPQFVKVCGRCKDIFESKTGREPREDVEKYDGGENR